MLTGLLCSTASVAGKGLHTRHWCCLCLYESLFGVPLPLHCLTPMGAVPATGRWTWGTSSGEHLGRSSASLGASFRMLLLPFPLSQRASIAGSHDPESLLMRSYDIFRRSILTLPAPSTASRSGSEQVQLTMHNPASRHTYDASLQWQV